MSMFKRNPDRNKEDLPSPEFADVSEQNRRAILTAVALTMVSDGEIATEEFALCEEIAKKLGLRKECYPIAEALASMAGDTEKLDAILKSVIVQMQDVKSASVLFESIAHMVLVDGKYTVIEDGIMRVMGRAFGMDHDTWALQMFKVGIAKGIDMGNLEEP